MLGCCTIVAGWSGCVATPPQGGLPPGSVADGGAPRFATLARCSVPGACPGVACGALAQGRPDGRSVDLRGCGVLDLYFTNGTVVAVTGSPSLVFHVVRFESQPPVRVEASSDGTQYFDIGFLNTAASVDARCLATRVEGRFLLDLAAGSSGAAGAGGCRAMPQVTALRLSAVTGATGAGAAGAGTLEIDAVEALEGAFRAAR